MRFRRASGDGLDGFQPRLWLVLLGLLAVFAYLVAFIVRNDDTIHVDFVFFTATVSLIWEIVLILGLGVLGGVLMSQVYRRRRSHEAGETPDRLP